MQDIAAERFGWDELRPGQLEPMQALLDDRDALVVMATGYGKSAVYQLPAVLRPGLTVVVSPLIALQADQVENLNDTLGEERAFAINSAARSAEETAAWQAIDSGTATFAFLSPEQLAKDVVVDRLAAAEVSLFVVDEAHCVSSWGHDFRPDYLRLDGAVRRLGRPPVLALTATASTPVQHEIIERLGLTDPRVSVRGFDRANLELGVNWHRSDEDKRRAVTDMVAELAGPGLLYVATRKDTERYAAELAERGLRTAAYHAGMKAADRHSTHERFLDDELDVVAATSAFGMGIDKPNVRFVVHADIPDSLDSYYQEIGRAGRDDEPAVAILHYRPEDLGLRRFFNARKPHEDDVRKVFAAVQKADGPLRPKKVAGLAELSTRKVTGLLNLLADSGSLRTGRKGFEALDDITPGAAVKAALAEAVSREHIEQSRLEYARSYAETPNCRRELLIGYFGEDFAGPCGNCDNCTGADDAEGERDSVINLDGPLAAAREEQAEQEAAPPDAGAAGQADDHFPLQAAVVHAEWGPGTVMSHEDDRITVFFEQEGYKTLARELIAGTDILRPAESA
nr:RecQ family ATP-dependent DNA helicase [Brevibacterium daeguense]